MSILHGCHDGQGRADGVGEIGGAERWQGRLIDAESLKDNLTDIYGDSNNLVYLYDALDLIDAQPTLTPPNEPLTLEQQREMDGEPAYIPETNCWVLVIKNPFVPLFTWPDGEQCSAYDWYEQVGPIYRRPPKEQEDNNDGD